MPSQPCRINTKSKHQRPCRIIQKAVSKHQRKVYCKLPVSLPSARVLPPAPRSPCRIDAGTVDLGGLERTKAGERGHSPRRGGGEERVSWRFTDQHQGLSGELSPQQTAPLLCARYPLNLPPLPLRAGTRKRHGRRANRRKRRGKGMVKSFYELAQGTFRV